MMHRMSTPTRTVDQEAVTLDPWVPPATAEPAAANDADAVSLLVQTRPWVRLIAVVIFIALGFVVLGTALLFMASGQLPGIGRREATMAAAMMVGIAALYVAPAIFLWRYAGSIDRLQRGGGPPALTAALSQQKSFWKYMGILLVVMLGLYGLVIAGGMMTGLLGTLLKH
jgi:hypothetical protein